MTNKDTHEANKAPLNLATAVNHGQHDGAPSYKLASLYKNFHHEDKILVVITADPDSIASAVALKRLLWHKVSHVDIASTNEVRRPDNLRLLKALELNLLLVKDLDLSHFTKFAIVDGQPHHNPLMAGIHFTLVIDHHPLAQQTIEVHKPEFLDVRPDWGATASILLTYLKAASIKPNKTLATALFYAIKTDTQNFVRQGQIEDMRAFRYLYPLIHHPLLTEIEMAPIDRNSFEVFKRALTETSFFNQYAFVFLEDLDHPDTLVIVADFIMQIDGVTRAIISGVFENRLIVVLRSAGLRSNLGKLASLAFGPFGSAGGHKNMARAEIELCALGPKVGHKSTNLSRFIKKRLADALSNKPLHHKNEQHKEACHPKMGTKDEEHKK
ncbi:MAG: DHH family phosphoesterase [Deltaproteobacteria bacterium]|jgi:nanoRNase/pAp phosphatase (c-di-AMP/oligoRNAs hydrolase)|nr:DHH family phosphoesterase [Deltaproteobacteria bacterium]